MGDALWLRRNLSNAALFDIWRLNRERICIFYREREQGWYRWSRTWGEGPTYERITSGQVALRHRQDEDEKIMVLPENYEELGCGGDDDIMIMDARFMMEEDEYRIASNRSGR